MPPSTRRDADPAAESHAENVLLGREAARRADRLPPAACRAARAPATPTIRPALYSRFRTRAACALLSPAPYGASHGGERIVRRSVPLVRDGTRRRAELATIAPSFRAVRG